MSHLHFNEETDLYMDGQRDQRFIPQLFSGHRYPYRSKFVGKEPVSEQQLDVYITNHVISANCNSPYHRFMKAGELYHILTSLLWDEQCEIQGVHELIDLATIELFDSYKKTDK
ncbi:hypothetical protein [Reichenbachiella sp.]|uniref:hypothetical protein n=1 Tax=Reichenbachiella sp. TaxID=2184521 RepID=UPI003B59CB54